MTRCKASFLCLAFRPRWVVGDCRRGISHGYAATMIFGGSACFRASCVGGGAAGAAGQEGEGGGGGGPHVAARMEVWGGRKYMSSCIFDS